MKTQKQNQEAVATPQHKSGRVKKAGRVMRAFAWFIVSSSLIFSSYCTLTNFNELATTVNGVLQGTLGVFIIGWHFLKSYNN